MRLVAVLAPAILHAQTPERMRARDLGVDVCEGRVPGALRRHLLLGQRATRDIKNPNSGEMNVLSLKPAVR